MIVTDVNNNKVAEYTLIIYGDIDGDGQITSVDLLRLQRHILEISILEPIFELAGNTLKNGLGPTSIDLLRIQRHILEIQFLEQ